MFASTCWVTSRHRSSIRSHGTRLSARVRGVQRNRSELHAGPSPDAGPACERLDESAADAYVVLLPWPGKFTCGSGGPRSWLPVRLYNYRKIVSRYRRKLLERRRKIATRDRNMRASLPGDCCQFEERLRKVSRTLNTQVCPTLNQLH